jgi:hypothetical protein
MQTNRRKMQVRTRQHSATASTECEIQQQRRTKKKYYNLQHTRAQCTLNKKVTTYGTGFDRIPCLLVNGVTSSRRGGPPASDRRDRRGSPVVEWIDLLLPFCVF